MKTYALRYFEIYEGDYEVEANSEEEAKEKVRIMLQDGELDGPEQCQGAGFSYIREV